jgi:sugar O-acyltransferase (sialic acid O-acetyltransferase NeuD family)
MTESCVLFGVDSVYSVDVIETLRRLGFAQFLGVTTGDREWNLEGVDSLCEESNITESWLSYAVTVPWVTPRLRYERTVRAMKAGFTKFDVIIDPTAIVATTTEISSGVFVNAGVVLGSRTSLGEGASINRSASVGHHSRLQEFVSVGPGAVIAARCSIGGGVMIGAGAAIAPGIEIGEHSIIGLGAAVIRDVPANTMVAGNPAKSIRSGLPGFVAIQT